MSIGEVYKNIRRNKNLTQKEICQDEVTTVTLSKFENGKLMPSHMLMKFFLQQIDMSFDEFEFLCDLDEPKVSHTIKRKFKTIISNLEVDKITSLIQQCEEYLKETREPSILETKKILQLLLEINYSGSNEYTSQLALQIWNTIVVKKEWYISELTLLNQILFYFPVETVFDIVDRILERLDEYSGYKELLPLKTSILVNLSTLYLDEYKFDECEKILILARKEAEKVKRYDFIVICLVRLGILRKESKMIDEGLELLSILGDYSFRAELEKEAFKFSKMI